MKEIKILVKLHDQFEIQTTIDRTTIVQQCIQLHEISNKIAIFNTFYNK